jgi:Ca2+-binding EF-hand superfamily protein
MIQVSKRASRKILSQCHNTIVELIGKLDRLEEGILNKEELKQALVEQKINELDAEELNTLLKYCDKGLKGYVSANRFIDKLYALAGESEADVILRRLSKALSHSDTNLRQEMQRQDTTGSGKLDKIAFKKCLKQLNLALTDSEIQTIIQELGLSAGQSASSSKKEAAELIDIKKFSAQVAEAGKAKPLPNFVLQGPKGSSKLA